MKKDFIKKVLAERIYDTDKYRYVVKECNDAEKCWQEIRRLPLEDLDTTAALNGWETVAVIEK